MLESQHLRSNLDQDWMRGMGVVLHGILESQQSRSNLDQDWVTSIGILPASMLDLGCFGEIWTKTGWEVLGICYHKSQRYARMHKNHTFGQIWIKTDQNWLRETQHLRSNLDMLRIVVSVCMNRSSVGQIWIQTG